VAIEGLAVAGAESEPEVLKDLAKAPGFSFGVDGLQGKLRLLFVLCRCNERREEDEA
jgi:hypothetical protein